MQPERAPVVEDRNSDLAAALYAAYQQAHLAYLIYDAAGDRENRRRVFEAMDTLWRMYVQEDER